MSTKAEVQVAVNGVNHSVALRNGDSASNGVTNGFYTNGSTNGHSNGANRHGIEANGYSNGHSNGCSNGFSSNGHGIGGEKGTEFCSNSSEKVIDGATTERKKSLQLNEVYGIPLPMYITKKVVDDLRVFPLRNDDLFIVTYPKSGTTWMQQIVKLIRNNGVDDSRPVTDVVPWIEQEPEKVKALPSPRAIMAHSHFHMTAGGDPLKSPAKYIYIARNPKDVAVSYYHHTKAFKHFGFSQDWNDFYELFLEGKVSRGSWFDHVLGWWEHKDADNILFLKYEDMKKDLKSVVQTVAKFVGYDLESEVVDRIVQQSTFNSMKSNSSANYSWQNKDRKSGSKAFIRKGLIGDWMNHFSEEQSTRFDAEYYKQMAGSGLRFDFCQ